ncbi:MAG: helix-turn-helix domain-containing protein [Desulfobacterales bacterium]|nr:helix-turn-helix domain-containing protein [Desulfobacterales bacterium]
MGTAVLPLKYSLVKYMNGKAKVTAKELFDSATPRYGNEKQLSLANVEKHLSALRAAGLIDMVDVAFNGDGDLNCSYKLTDYGQSRLKKYVPQG